MSLRKITAQTVYSWVDDLIAGTKVIGVQAKEDRFDWGPLFAASDLRLAYDVSLTPPGRACFQPPEELMLRFDGADYRTVLADEPFVLFGVHPYDMVAINQMDRVFAKDHWDVHYMTRRQAATIVACDVQTPSKNVFAGYMGTAVVDEGFDVLLTRLDGSYLVDVRTDKGEALAASLADQPTADEADLAARQQVWEDNEKELRKHELKAPPGQWAELLEKGYDHPVWEEMAELCFSCASCNTVCPTCYCFDVQDDVTWDLKSGGRSRLWDGCLLAKFARVAGEHNFRDKRCERYRHRYYRKGKYVPEMIGQCACVGCGRCISACVADIANPVVVFNRLLEGE